ncbi:hypothetical protein 2AV2_145 [Nodularia phage vB_NpeS-2AV2]|uniref:Uncharacterized protein n=3 Tax=Ravarandavirus TaxID=2843444 RepID=A0A482MKB6_9CAUD|nr:hypothetical protein HWA92_gp145 [Nodularia phage vB_NpeS-2AV2]YP_009844968.1 hypothetical protein HWC13_gp152 [Nodularia phage vB_NspS-kac68v161]ALY07597.1 hypothetical protein 2AV2_145 [Nodularia phage vB_NpeS-2AV2]QBQ73809.1 hypothetical protein kac68v161_gp159 [Nodularia phage vB_NspS-kac68v161]QBQ74005.1 hypothetical protein kac68v162_gp157 [Nodularia phage vB_NspS-kac68v162]
MIYSTHRLIFKLLLPLVYHLFCCSGYGSRQTGDIFLHIYGKFSIERLDISINRHSNTQDLLKDCETYHLRLVTYFYSNPIFLRLP